jgi:hypothetical protein
MTSVDLSQKRNQNQLNGNPLNQTDILEKVTGKCNTENTILVVGPTKSDRFLEMVRHI